MTQAAALAQSNVHDKVERYLFSSYESNKAGIREGERMVKQLDSKMDEYLLSLNNAVSSQLKEKDKEFNAFLKRLMAVKDIKAIQQMVEDSKKSQKTLISSVLQQGVTSLEEAQECHKIMAFKVLEIELMQLRQDRLFNLLKDEPGRRDFVARLVEEQQLSEKTDIRKLMATVDLRLSESDI